MKINHLDILYISHTANNSRLTFLNVSRLFYADTWLMHYQALNGASGTSSTSCYKRGTHSYIFRITASWYRTIMHLIEIIPLVRMPHGAPDILSYYTSRDIPAGSLVAITINKRPGMGVVKTSVPLSDVKALVRKQDFSLKKIDMVLGIGSIPEYSLKLFLWTAKYFCAPKSLLFKSALPNYFAKPSAGLKKFLAATVPSIFFHRSVSHTYIQPIYIEGSFHERLLYYKEKIQNLLHENPRAQILMIFPTLADAARAAEFYSDTSRDIILYTSSLPKRDSALLWRRAFSGEARLIIGTRNAVFIPIPNLLCVIIDGENSIHHKSWDSYPRWDARDIAEKISETLSIPLILGGNFPREETWYRIQEGEILCEQTASDKKVAVTIVDIKKEIKEYGEFKVMSALLEEKIRRTLADKGRVFCYSGRRGYASHLMCRDCGHMLLCVHCQAPLVIHVLPDSASSRQADLLTSRILICHKCLKRAAPPDTCPECGSHAINSFAIGSQRMEEELKKLFPDARILRIDTDASDDPRNLLDFFSKVKQGKYDIVVGTDLALKPSAIGTFSLTSIVSFNQLLQQPDFRQEERAFGVIQNLLEITLDECVIQTRNSAVPLIREIETHDAESFFKRDGVFRKAYAYPPFAEIIKIILADKLRLVAEKNSLIIRNILAKEFTKAGIKREDVFIIGPLPAFIPKEKNQYIYHLVLKIKNRNDSIKDILLQHLPSYARIDVNPKTIL